MFSGNESILVTGGAGFIGSAFVRHVLKILPHCDVTVYDRLTYAGNLQNLAEALPRSNCSFVRGDITNSRHMTEVMKNIDIVVHFAAESHVDRSVNNPLAFTLANTLGTQCVLEAARSNRIKQILHVSTDEVYGENLGEASRETDALHPTNPYSASKAAAEMIIEGYYHSFGINVKRVRCTNAYGPYQYPEKIIPCFVTRLMQGEKIPLQDPLPRRCYLYVQDLARALLVIIRKGQAGEVYNIGATEERSNEEVAQMVLRHFGKDSSWIMRVPNRPFNDQRYQVDSRKIVDLGWQPEVGFDVGLARTIAWYRKNEHWCAGSIGRRATKRNKDTEVCYGIQPTESCAHASLT